MDKDFGRTYWVDLDGTQEMTSCYFKRKTGTGGIFKKN